jgi:hypothetical protein
LKLETQALERDPGCFDQLSIHGFGSDFSGFSPFVLSLLKDSDNLDSRIENTGGALWQIKIPKSVS